MINIIKSVLSLFEWLSKYFHDKQLISAGVEKERAKANEETLKTLKAIQDARSDPAERVRIRDKYRDAE